MLFSLVPRLEEEEEKGLGLAPPLWPGIEATCLRYRGTANLYFSDTCRKIFFWPTKIDFLIPCFSDQHSNHSRISGKLLHTSSIYHALHVCVVLQ